MYVIFGSSKDMCLGPSAIQSLLTGIYATSPIAEDLTFALLLTFFSGVLQLAMFLFGLGKDAFCEVGCMILLTNIQFNCMAAM